MIQYSEVAVENLVSFVRFLRSAGFAVSTATTLQLVEAARIVGMHRGSDVREAFRAVVVTRRGESARFDDIFDRFFTGDLLFRLDDVVDRVAERKPIQQVPRIGAVGGTEVDESEQEDEAFDIVGGSASERLMDVDFAQLSIDEAAAVAALLASMTWTPSSFPSRRRQAAADGSVPDLRRTLRKLAGPQGDLLPLAFTERTPRQRPLIVLADVSGSMERYSEMLLHFVHGAQHKYNRVEAFVFATRLTRITRQLRRRNPTEALAEVAKTVPDWSGGTRIGEAIGTFNRSWSRRIGGGGPIALIVSDGWDTGDPEVMSMEMRRLARAMNRVIWLNPLADHVEYSPEARGMAAALPFVDDLLAGGTARNLVDLIDLLQASEQRRRSAAAQ